MISRKVNEIKEITKIVNLVRAEYRITPMPILDEEQSWTTAGDERSLFYSQLVTTLEGQGGWQALENPDVRATVLAFVREERTIYDENRRQRNLNVEYAAV